MFSKYGPYPAASFCLFSFISDNEIKIVDEHTKAYCLNVPILFILLLSYFRARYTMVRTWSSCHITSPFNNNLGCFLLYFKKVCLTKQPIFLLKGKLSGKSVIRLYLKSSMVKIWNKLRGITFYEIKDVSSHFYTFS